MAMCGRLYKKLQGNKKVTCLLYDNKALVKSEKVFLAQQ
jgi:hypothetical protein